MTPNSHFKKSPKLTQEKKRQLGCSFIVNRNWRPSLAIFSPDSTSVFRHIFRVSLISVHCPLYILHSTDHLTHNTNSACTARSRMDIAEFVRRRIRHTLRPWPLSRSCLLRFYHVLIAWSSVDAPAGDLIEIDLSIRSGLVDVVQKSSNFSLFP
jgi:hypothetical protein